MYTTNNNNSSNSKLLAETDRLPLNLSLEVLKTFKSHIIGTVGTDPKTSVCAGAIANGEFPAHVPPGVAITADTWMAAPGSIDPDGNPRKDPLLFSEWQALTYPPAPDQKRKNETSNTDQSKRIRGQAAAATPVTKHTSNGGSESASALATIQSPLKLLASGIQMTVNATSASNTAVNYVNRMHSE